jgi:hypothetical protein
MRFITPKIVFIILVMVLVGNALAVEIEEGVEYKGKITVVSQEYGTSFELPTGWNGILPKDGEFFVMKSQSFEGYVFAGIDQMTIEEAIDAMGQDIDLGDGVVFHPSSQVKRSGSTLSAEYSVSGPQDSLVGYVTTIVGKYGLGISFISVSSPENTAKLLKAVEKIKRSLSLFKPKETSPSSPEKSSGSWNEQLSGRKLSHFVTRSGYTEEDYIWLCLSGRFFKSRQSGGFGGGASGAFQSENAGVWSVSGGVNAGTLVLTYNDGSTARYTLTLEGTKLYLDGKRYFREDTNCD